jgi:FixJ family two-component response regulator
VKLPFEIGDHSIGLPWASDDSQPIRVMLIDDDKDEASLTRSLLGHVKDIRYELDWVGSFEEGVDSIARDEHDAFLIDHNLGNRTGIELVRGAREAGSLAALIMLTGQRDRATDIAAMDAGATDFLMKGRTDAALLDRTLRYAITQAAMLAALDRSRNQMAGLEELGRILVEEGPTPTTIEHIVDLIVERFALHQIAIYLADGDLLRLAGQHGYGEPLTTLSRVDSSIDRVTRAGQPIFVPSMVEPGASGTGNVVASELSVPLLIAGELVGLMNVASFVTAPIGEEDHSAIRLVADRLTAALAVVRERTITEERLMKAQEELRGGNHPPLPDGITDDQTSAYLRPFLEPLVEVAIAGARMHPERKVGLLLVAWDGDEAAAGALLASQVRLVFAHDSYVRFGERTLAVLVVATDEPSARARAGDLMAMAEKIDLDVWCGHAALASDQGARELISEAEAALALARTVGHGSIIG